MTNIFTIVISRFNEDLEWLKEPRFKNHKIVCYNKGEDDLFYKHPNMEIISLPNVGMCNHTYLHHIISNYDNLDELTLFLPGSCMDANKLGTTNATFYRMLQTNDSVFAISQTNDVRQNLYNFTLDFWKVSNFQNIKSTHDGALKLCRIRPFGKFYEYYFGNLYTPGVNYFSIYGVTKTHILQSPKKLFEDLIDHVDKDTHTEAAHYLERIALAMFHPIPQHCILYY